MDNQNQTQNLFYAFDGDGIGIKHAQAILSDDVQSINNISSEITAANEMVRQFVESSGGQMISFGGDEGLFQAPADFVEMLEQLREEYVNMVGATLSIGVGSKPSEAGKALLKAKQTGKNQVVQYDEDAERYAQDVQNQRDSENHPEEESEEQQKINAVLESDGPTDQPVEMDEDGGGLETDQSDGQVLPEESDSNENEPTLCEPHQEDNNRGYDSGYKDQEVQDRDESYQQNDLTPPTDKKANLEPKSRTMEGVSTDIQEGNRLMNEELPDPESEEPMITKPAPRVYEGQAEGGPPNGSDATQFQGGTGGELKYSTGEQPEPQPNVPDENATSDQAEDTENQDMLGDQQDNMQHCPSCTCGAHGEGEAEAEGEGSADDLLDQNLDNTKEFEDSIDDGQPQSTDELLDAHLENAADMEQNMDDQGVSRPEDYDEKAGDLGLSEEDAGDPDLSEVLQGGLDQHADSIQREKVMQMVGQALDAFKGQKAILDKAKAQAPELHDACVSMLRAMIELCSLAGINEGQAEQDVNEIEGADQPEEQPGAEGAPQEGGACPNCGKPHDEAPEAAPGEEPTDTQAPAPGGQAPFPKK